MKTNRRLALVAGALLPLAAAAGQNDVLNVLAGMSDGSWAKLNTNTFQSVWTPMELRAMSNTSYSSQPESIITAWSSFAWDSNRSQMWLYGGGHANYAGNEMYTFNTSTFQWQRASLPSDVTKYSDGGYDFYIPKAPDNGNYSPQSAHTYDNTVYLPRADRYVTFGGGGFNHGYGYNQIVNGQKVLAGPYFFDPNRADANKVGGVTGSGVNPLTEGGNMWQNRNMTQRTDLAARFPTNFIDGTSDYAVENGKEVIYKTGHQETLQVLYKYTVNDVNDPSKDTWEQIGAVNSLHYQSAGALDPVRRVYVQTGRDPSHDGPFGPMYFNFWNLASAGPNNPNYEVKTVVAPADFVMSEHFGIDYDESRGVFVLWDGGRDVWTLELPDPDANGLVSASGWVVTKDSVVGPEAPGGTPANTAGILGKWQYAPELNAFIGLSLDDPTAGNVWVYRPEGWVNPVPEPSTWAMLGAGLLAIGRIARRRRAAAAALAA